MVTVTVTGALELECSNCGAQTDVASGNIHFDLVGTESKGMGTENEYHADINLDCSVDDDCGAMQVGIDVWEYPVGCLDTTDTSSSGCEVLSLPSLSCDMD